MSITWCGQDLSVSMIRVDLLYIPLKSRNSVDDAKENQEEIEETCKENLYDEPDNQENYPDDDDYPVQVGWFL